MIARIRGILLAVNDESALVDVNGLTYSIMITRPVGERLIATGRIENEVVFHTMYYIEGGVGVGNLVPRLVGFLNESDLDFFRLLITVQGLSAKRSLRALTLPVKDVARAIELNDTSTLRKLPEIGGKLAQKIVMELKGKAARFALLREEEVPDTVFTSTPGEEYQEEALEVLVQLQYSRSEAEDIVRRVSHDRPDIKNSEELIQEIFRRQVR